MAHVDHGTGHKNSEGGGRPYPLFWVNMVVAGLLVLVIGIAAVRLFVRVQRGKFGSRLLLKLAAIFALVGVLPGVLIYTVSYD